MTLSYQAALVVTCILLDAATRAPLPLADVRSTFTRSTTNLGVTSSSSSTDRQARQPTQAGRLILSLRPHPKDTEQQLTLAADGYRAYEHAAIALEGQTHIDLGEIALASAPRLRVRVARADTREPIAEAKVSVSVPSADASSLGTRRRGLSVGASTRVAAQRTRRQQAGATSASTDRDGVAELALSSGERGALRVRAEGFAPSRVELSALPTEGVVEQVVELIAGGNVHVRVDDLRGRPVANATLAVQGSDPNEFIEWFTDAQGQARCDHLAPGEYRFSVKEKPQDGVLRVSTGNEPELGVAVVVADGETKELVLVHATRVEVTGKVTVNGEPAAGLTIDLEPAAQASASHSVEKELAGRLADTLVGSRGRKTNRQGVYRVDGVVLGEYRLTLRRDGELLPTSATVVVGDGGARCDVNLTTGVVEGLVVDSDGQPIGAAQVRVAGSAPQDAASALTDVMALLLPAKESGGVSCGADGRFRIDAIGGAEVVVHASTPQHCVGMSAPFTLQPHQAVRDVRVVLQRGGRLRVRVNGEGSVSVFVERLTEPPFQRTATVRDGVAEFGPLPPGRWRVGLRMPLGAPGPATDVEVVAGQTAELALSR